MEASSGVGGRFAGGRQRLTLPINTSSALEPDRLDNLCEQLAARPTNGRAWASSSVPALADKHEPRLSIAIGMHNVCATLISGHRVQCQCRPNLFKSFRGFWILAGGALRSPNNESEEEVAAACCSLRSAEVVTGVFLGRTASAFGLTVSWHLRHRSSSCLCL